jgi:hypothetical protein
MLLRRLSLLAIALCLAAPASRAELVFPRPSPHASVSQTIGITELSITYSRPGVKGRAIWDSLVAYNKPWRTGANELTQFKTADDIKVEGQTLPAGTYGLVAIPAADQWIFAFTRDKDLWGTTDYNPEHDQLRVTVKPQAAAMQERMLFTIEPTADGECDVVLAWEKLRVPFHVVVDVNNIVLRGVRAEVAAADSNDWRTPYRAANWALGAHTAQMSMTEWAASARKIKENFQTLSLAAKLLALESQPKGAVALGEKALASAKGDKDVRPDETAALEKLVAEWRTRR